LRKSRTACSGLFLISTATFPDTTCKYFIEEGLTSDAFCAAMNFSTPVSAAFPFGS
jgi:hypothetical protein